MTKFRSLNGGLEMNKACKLEVYLLSYGPDLVSVMREWVKVASVLVCGGGVLTA